MERVRLPGSGAWGTEQQIDLTCVSIPGRRVPLGLLGALSFPRDQLEEALVDVRARAGAREVCVVSTCERVELYATGVEPGATSVLLEALAENRGVCRPAVEAAAHLLTGREAVTHLLRVTAGLESFVLGERDIVGQVRAAAEASRAAGVMGLTLERLMATAVNTSRRVHRGTHLGEAGRSVAGAAVQVAALESGGDLVGRRMLVVGAGDVATQVAEAATRLGAAVTVCNRTRRHAERWAAAGATVVDLDQLTEALSATDVAIFGTAAPEPLIGAAELGEARRSADRTLLLLDLCVPRNVDPAARELSGVRLLDLTDLRATGGVEGEAVALGVATAERIIAEELDRYLRWLSRRAAVPAVRRLRDDLEARQRGHVDQAMPGVDDEPCPGAQEPVGPSGGQVAHEATRRLMDAAEAGDHHLVEALSRQYAAGPAVG